MKNLILPILLSPFLLFSQSSHKITGFSDQYYGLVEIETGYENEVFKPGSIAIYDRKGAKLISLDVEEIAFEVENEDTSTEINYEKQSMVIYEDFNFDGKKDIALLEGQNSCYHQPSYNIYLASNQDFRLNEAFSNLAQHYCGMFQIYEGKIITHAKSGCCWHETSEFIVVDNKPQVTRILTEDGMNHPYYISTTEKWKDGNKIEEEVEKVVDISPEEVLLSFKLAKSGKLLTLFILNDENLNYVLEKTDDQVEFNYPKEPYSREDKFTYKSSGNSTSVVFQNGGAKYEVYQSRSGASIEKLGVKVWVDGKLYDIKGDPKTVEGDLTSLKIDQMTNVIR